jgi:hypothetical protein
LQITIYSQRIGLIYAEISLISDIIDKGQIPLRKELIDKYSFVLYLNSRTKTRRDNKLKRSWQY